MVNYNENAIREAAYYIWQNAGCPNGKDQEFWSMAVEQLNGCNKSSCSKSSAKKSTSSSSKKSTSATCKTASAKKTSSSTKKSK